MVHPILALQGAITAALEADAALVALIGPNGVLDAPPKGRNPPYLVFARHDIRPLDGDAAPLLEHRVALHVWSDAPSRKAVLLIVERAASVLAGPLVPEGRRVTLSRQERLETMMDGKTGNARAMLALVFHTEPA